MPIITTQKQLDIFLDHCLTQKFVAIDTEFIRTDTYYSQLCLIQIASKEQAHIIDVIAYDFNLAKFYQLLQSKVLKIFHAARQDIEIFVNKSEKVPVNIFDTQIAMMAISNHDQIGYEQFIQIMLGKTINKSFRLTNWASRPLATGAIEYALMDVTLLILAFTKLMEKLNEKNRLMWIEDELNDLLNIEHYNFPAKDAWKKVKFNASNQHQIFIIKALAKFREELAREKNKPRNHIFSDDIIKSLARLQPKEKHLLQHPGKKYKALMQHADKILSLINQEFTPPNIIKKAESQKLPKDLLILLKIIRDWRAQKLCCIPRLLINNKEINALKTDDLYQYNFMQGWRYEEIGKYIEKLINKTHAIGIVNDKIELIKC